MLGRTRLLLRRVAASVRVQSRRADPLAFSFRTDDPPDFFAELPDGPGLIARITDHAQFHNIVEFFADNPSAKRSLMSPNAQALLYCLVRILKPSDVIEIGIYHCGTSEAICRALAANGFGTLHAVEPFTAELAGEIVRRWPHGIDRFIKIYNETSMQFFMRIEERHIKPAVVFIDGDHSFEFAQFDISASARFLNPSGFIFVDNVAQPGPFLATKDFLAANPSWTTESRELPLVLKGYDRERPTVINTDFAVVRAPASYVVDARPRSFGPMTWNSNSVARVILKFATPASEQGILSAQIILRAFGSELREAISDGDITLERGSVSAMIQSAGLAFDRKFNSYSVETVLRWSGQHPLLLAQAPSPEVG